MIGAASQITTTMYRINTLRTMCVSCRESVNLNPNRHVFEYYGGSQLSVTLTRIHHILVSLDIALKESSARPQGSPAPTQQTNIQM